MDSQQEYTFGGVKDKLEGVAHALEAHERDGDTFDTSAADKLIQGECSHFEQARTDKCTAAFTQPETRGIFLFLTPEKSVQESVRKFLRGMVDKKVHTAALDR